MATWAFDTFTDTNLTPLTSHTSDSSHTWTVAYSTNASIPVIYSTLGGVVAAKQQIIILALNAESGTTEQKSTTVYHYDSINFAAVGSMLRLNSANGSGYLAGYSASQQKWIIDRISASGAGSTTLGSSAVIPYTQNATPTAIFTVSGTGATVNLVLNVGGVDVVTTTDTSASRITTAGKGGIFLNSGVNDQGMYFNSVTYDTLVTTPGVTITTPTNGTIVPLSGGTTGTGSFNLTGTFTASSIDQWRLVDDGGSTSITGFDWASFTVAPSGGAFSQTIPLVPKKNGWYNVQVRDSTVPGTFYTSGKVAPGALVGVDGQSNAWLWFSSTSTAGDSTLTPDPLLRITGKQPNNVWVAPSTATMNAAISCGNALVTALSCPVGLVDGSFDGSGLTVSGNGGQWVPTATAGQAYQLSLAAMNAAGGKLIANIWIQGERDAAVSVTQGSYYSALGTLIAQRRTDLSQSSLPYIVATLGRDLTGTQTDAQREAIKLAQVQKCADPNIYRVDRLDLPLAADNIHHNAAGFTALGQRCARAILASVGLVSEYRGPAVASILTVDPTTYDVTITHHSGTDFTPTSGITGFRATDPGASDAVIAITAGVRQSASVIRLTLASSPVSPPKISYLYGTAPVVTGVAKDNSTLALPLEYNDGIVAGAIATAVTLSGPSSGVINIPSSNFIVGANGPITGTVIVTPSDSGAGGTFNPTTVSISSSTPTGTFTYTGISTGAKTISVTNDGGLSNPSNITHTVNNPPAVVAGTPSLTSATSTTITVTSTAATSGTSPYTYQWYRSTTPNFTIGAETLVSGATSLTLADTSGSLDVPLYYKLRVTDSAAQTADTKQVSGVIKYPTLRLGFIGDSITAGYNLSAGQSPVDQIIPILKKIYKNRDVTAVNSGVNGSKTSEWVSGSSNLNTAKAAFSSASVTHIHIMLGANDAATSNLVSASTYRTNLANTLLDLTLAGYKVILSYPIFYPDGANVGAGNAASVALLKAYQAEIDSLINNTTILRGDVLGYNYFMDNLTEMQSDQVHPTVAGTLSLATMWARAIDRNVFGMDIPVPTRTISIVITTDGATPAANLTGLYWYWSDARGIIIDSGTNGTTNGSGVFSITVNSYLSSGFAGWLQIDNSDGNPSTAHSAFFGPVAIS